MGASNKSENVANASNAGIAESPAAGPRTPGLPGSTIDVAEVLGVAQASSTPPGSVIPPAPRVLGTPRPTTPGTGTSRGGAPRGGATTAAGAAASSSGRAAAASAAGTSTATVTPPGISTGQAVGGRGDSASSDGVRIVAPADLRRASELLREDVAQLSLPLEIDGAEDARRELNSLLSQLDDYLLPRLRRIDAPLLAVVGGSTGAGKSTLVNSLVRRFVTRSGVLRPTTRSPVLIHHPYDSGAFLTQRILPGFARVTSEAPEPLQPIEVDAPRVTALRLVPDEGLAPGLAIIDAPDIDSLVETNRDLAIQLLAAADLWLFVTTAARYSDAVPWDMLKTAVDRGVSVAVVLDRVPAAAMGEVRVHLAQMLRDRGLSTAPLFTIPESVKDGDGFLPEEAVAPLHGWLSRLARDSRSRDVVVRRTLVGALDSLHARVRLIAAAAERQVEARGALSAVVTESFDEADTALAAALGDGTLLRGEVLARWQEYVGTGEAFRGIEGTMGRLRDRVTAAVRGRPAPSAPLSEAVRTGVRAAVVTTAQAALERTTAGWRLHPAGAAVLASMPEAADDRSPSLTDGGEQRLIRAVGDWQTAVLDQVRTEGQGRWTSPRAAGLGAEGTAVLLMLLSLGLDADRPGPVVEVARRLLGAVLGDNTEKMARKAQADLVRRTGELLAVERERFTRTLGAAGVREDLAVALRTHLRSIERAR